MTAPIQLTTFIGREKEIAAVGELLETVRLLTLTGVGGAGKTRLASQVAARAAPQFDVTGWVDLAPVSDPALVGTVVATALGFREEGGRSAVETMVSRVCERATFVILDNCEHLVDACASLADTLLRTCSRIRILATSREALGVSGEQAWLVPPLPASDAEQLFVERARAVVPSFKRDQSNAAAIAQICTRLDGMPLAIELAAARVRVLAPDQIAARLDDAFKVLTSSGRSSRPGVARHRTLRETIDWSHALLSEAEARLFRRLSVFAGSFSLDAVEALCPADDILDLLSALVDKSLVVMEASGDEARYRLLETLRQYGHEKLVAAGEAQEFHARHARFFTDLAVTRERETFGGPGETAWGDQLVVEEGNLRAAGHWADEAHDYAMSLRLNAALHWHWFGRGNFRECWDNLEKALQHADRASPLEAGKAHAAAGTMAFILGKHEAIAPHARRAVELLRDQGDSFQLGYALVMLGVGQMADDPSAGRLMAEATALARAYPQYQLVTFTLYWHARYALMRGDLDAAERALTEGLALGRHSNRPPAIAHPLTLFGLLWIERGRLAQAVVDLQEALDVHARVNDIMGCIWTIEGLARVAQQKGNAPCAAKMLAYIRAERERIGTAWLPAERKAFGAMRAALEQQLGAEFAAAERTGDTLTLPDALALAKSVDADPHVPVTTTGEFPIPRSEGPELVLAVYALGPLRILKDDTPLERGAWASAKPRELLLYLLCHRDGRTREQIGLAFWPDASAEQVRNNFHVTLHRLRKTLGGAEWVVLEGERYLVNPKGAIYFDAEAFDSLLPGAAGRLTKHDDPKILESALDMYHGDFLASENAGDWHLELRDRVRLKFVEGLTALADWRMKKERWSEAADAWRRLIATDELDERAYRGLMTCHARQGERSHVQQLYKRLEQLLQKQLEAAPEADTAQLYKRLITH